MKAKNKVPSVRDSIVEDLRGLEEFRHPDYHAAYRWFERNNPGKKWDKGSTDLINKWRAATGKEGEVDSPKTTQEKAIRKILAKDPGARNRDIAKATGMSPSTVKRRIKDMSDRGELKSHVKTHTPARIKDGRAEQRIHKERKVELKPPGKESKYVAGTKILKEKYRDKSKDKYIQGTGIDKGTLVRNPNYKG